MIPCHQNSFQQHNVTNAEIAICGPWEVIAADCIDPLPAMNLGNRYILIMGDLFIKYIETAALSSIETTIITQVFLDKIVFQYGPPH